MMRALVVESPGRYGLREVDAPAFGPDDVLVRSVAAALCGTDVKILRGHLPDGVVSYPCIPGHEWSGVVQSVGARVSDLDPGDPVVCEGRLRCGHCAWCLAGDTNLCESNTQLGFTAPGGFGELVVAPRRVVHQLPDAARLETGALVEPLACVVHAFERGAVRPGHTIAVIGSGGLGSLAVLLARRVGAHRVVAYGVNETELILARRLGADEVHSTEPSSVEEADVTLETSGSEDAIRTAITATRRGGRIVLLGTAGEGASITFNDDEIVRRELDVVGSLSYTAAAWVTSLRLVTEQAIDVGSVITHRVPMAEYEAALRLFKERTEPVGRIILHHES